MGTDRRASEMRRTGLGAREEREMTGATTGSVPPHQADWRRMPAVVVAGVRRLWRAVGSLAELLSDVGHGPRRWQERSDVPNPYAGIGPLPPDDRHRQD